MNKTFKTKFCHFENIMLFSLSLHCKIYIYFACLDVCLFVSQFVSKNSKKKPQLKVEIEDRQKAPIKPSENKSD